MASATTRGPGPAPATPEGEVVSWADRIAYVCHDFEDAVSAGIVAPSMLPDAVAERVGRRRGRQLGTFIDAMVAAGLATGEVGMTAPAAEALAAFRQFNYERVYLRPASAAQARAVIAVLQAWSSTTPTGPTCSRPIARTGSRPAATPRCAPRSPTWAA